MEKASLETIAQKIERIWDIRMAYEDNRRLEDDPARKRGYGRQCERGKEYVKALERYQDALQACVDANNARRDPQRRPYRRRSDDLIGHMTGSLDIIAAYLLQIMEHPGDVVPNRRRWRQAQQQFGLFAGWLGEFTLIVPIQCPSAQTQFAVLPEPEG